MMSYARRGVIVVCVLASAFVGAVSPALAQGGSVEPTVPMPFVEFLNLVLQAAVAALAPIAVGFVIALVRQAVAKVRASVSADQWLLLQAIVSTVVQAAEQSGLAGHIAAEGKAKKEWAIAEIQRIAAERGLAGLDVATLAAMIEAEVYRQFNQPAQPVPLIVPPRSEG